MDVIKFIKAQALGNDFIIIQQQKGFPLLTTEQLQKMAARRTGVGCDQFIFFELEDSCSIHVSFYNADGSEALACGNGSRALATYVMSDLGCESPVTIQTKNACLTACKQSDGVSVTFPKPKLLHNDDIRVLPQTNSQLSPYFMADIGNQHLICFVEDLSLVPVETQGKVLEKHTLFGEEGINVSFAQIVDDSHIQLAVWERGAGFTGACGTAACATAFVAHRQGLVKENVVVHQLGGDLKVTLGDDYLDLKGEAEIIFVGEYSLI